MRPYHATVRIAHIHYLVQGRQCEDSDPIFQMRELGLRMTVARPQSAEQGRLLSLPCANPGVKARDELVTVDYSTGLGRSSSQRIPLWMGTSDTQSTPQCGCFSRRKREMEEMRLRKYKFPHHRPLEAPQCFTQDLSSLCCSRDLPTAWFS